jgi:nicotinamide-nucleotide amidase
VAVADGSTGGLISAGMPTIPRDIKFFRGGGVVYSLKRRQILFGLEPEAFAGLRAVSETYTLPQADGIRQRLEADRGIAESGSAGPSPSGRDRGRHQLHRRRRPWREDEANGRERLILADLQYGSVRL